MENKEHNLQDKRCQCCGYMTYHREHMGCIRAAEQAQQAEPVAWCWQFPDGYFYETPHQTKEDCERDCCGYDGVAIPLYDTRGEKTLPTDVVAILEEAEDVLRRVGCDMTAANIRKVLQAQRVKPVALTNDQIEELWRGELDNRSLGCIRNIIAAAQPPAVAVAPGEWHAAMSFARSALAEAIQIAPLDKLPRMAGAAMQQIDALLADMEQPK